MLHRITRFEPNLLGAPAWDFEHELHRHLALQPRAQSRGRVLHETAQALAQLRGAAGILGQLLGVAVFLPRFPLPESVVSRPATSRRWRAGSPVGK